MPAKCVESFQVELSLLDLEFLAHKVYDMSDFIIKFFCMYPGRGDLLEEVLILTWSISDHFEEKYLMYAHGFVARVSYKRKRL